ncbi:sensor histidine kinase [Sphingobacterium corticis]
MAKIILLGVSFCFFYFGALFYGNGGENFLLCIMIVCMLLYDSRTIQWFAGVFVIAGIVSVKLYPTEFLMIDHVVRGRVLTNTLGALIFIVIAVYFFKNIIYNNMMLIEEQRKKLQLLNQDKERIFSIVAHDIRTPLSTLDGLVYLLHEQVLDGTVSEEYILQLQRQIAQQKEALDDILYWSSRSMRGASNSITTTSVLDVMSTIGKVYESACQLKSLQLIMEIEPNFQIKVDRDHLMIVARNMLSNAVKFSHSGGSIEVWVSEENAYGFLHVRDHGIGMGKEQADHLFHTIQQRSLGTGKEVGAGLGLLLCHELIQQNNGMVRVSSALGEGSTFSVGFPMVTHA